MTPEEAKERLVFVRAVLALLLETHLFGPLLERAAGDLDAVLEAMGEPVEKHAG